MTEKINNIYSLYKRIISKTKEIWLLSWHSKFRWLNYFAILSGSIFILILLLWVLLLTGVFGHIPNKIEIRNINNPIASEIYDDKDQVFGKYYLENRTNASWDDVSQVVYDALISTEDIRFYEHDGIDMQSLGRVFFKTLGKGQRSEGGGSTITQQLSKNVFGRPNEGFMSLPLNKLREMIIAKRIEKVYSKKDIITLYLNTVSWGSDIFGIRVASRRYFSRSAKELNLEEAAALIGMLKATTAYNPIKYKEKAKLRRNLVLKRMAQNGFISQSVADSVAELPIQVREFNENHYEGKATYFREFVRLQIDSLLQGIKKDNGKPYNVYTDGLKIYTTINLDMQALAEAAVDDHMRYIQKEFNNVWRGGKPWRKDDYIMNIIPRTERYQKMKLAGYKEDSILASFYIPIDMYIWDWSGERKIKMTPLDSIKHYSKMYRAGLVSVEPSTGYVKAWIGGVNFKYMKYDHVTSLRQVGSTFKPIVYSQALRHGFKPCSFFSNEVKTYKQWHDWRPENIDGFSGGSYTMARAMAKSINVVAANVAIESNIDSVAMLAKQMGLTGYVPPFPAIALGAVDASLYDMVQVFSVFANRGVKKELVYVRRIENKFGEVIFSKDTLSTKTETILTPDQADIMTKMLENVVDNGTADIIRRIYIMEGEIAGKTGTSQHEADGWFMGFTPDLCTGVWVGGEAPVIHFRYGHLGQGAASALPIWVKYHYKVWINSKLKKYKKSKFVEPSDSIKHLLSCEFNFTYDDPSYTNSSDMYEEPDEDSVILESNDDFKYVTVTSSDTSIPKSDTSNKTIPVKKDPVEINSDKSKPQRNEL